ncbi:MAG: hypothetical protein Q9160_006003 [Pyrenula sp. 1 TL-2023]
MQEGSHPRSNVSLPGHPNVTTVHGPFVPSIKAVTCTSDLNKVNVDATFSQVGSTDSSNPQNDLRWSPVSFGNITVSHEQQYNRSAFPYWIAFAKAGDSIDQYDESTNAPGELASDSLFPTNASATNFFQLLAIYSEYSLKNSTAILDQDTFTAAVEALYTMYTTEILTDLKSFAAQNASSSISSKPQSLSGTLIYLEERIAQDKGSTIVVELLLGAMAICLIWVFSRFPSESILPKCPGSIAARASFLAHSRLVQMLRSESVGSMKKTQIWNEKAAIRWWMALGGEDHRHGQNDAIRWGIDVGEGASHESWKHVSANLTGARSSISVASLGNDAPEDHQSDVPDDDQRVSPEVDQDHLDNIGWGSSTLRALSEISPAESAVSTPPSNLHP